MPDEVDNKSQADKSEQLAKVKRKWPKWKIVLILLVVFVVVPFAVWLIANRAMEIRLEVEINKYRNEGLPLSDSLGRCIAGSENTTTFQLLGSKMLVVEADSVSATEWQLKAAYKVRAANEDFRGLCERVYFESANIHGGYPPKYDAKFAAFLSVTKKDIMPLMKEARLLNRYSLLWMGFSGREEFFFTLRYANFFMLACAYDGIAKQNDVEAIQSLADMQRIFASYQTAGWYWELCISDMHRWMIDRPSEATEYILPRIKTAGLSRDESAAIIRELEVLKQFYLNEDGYLDAIYEAFTAMRLAALSEMSSKKVFIDEKLKWEDVGKIVLLPLAKKNAIDNIRGIALAGDAAKHRDVASLYRQYKEYRDNQDVVRSSIVLKLAQDAISDSRREFYHLDNPGWIISHVARSLPRMRLAAVAIAMKQYEIENGKPPAALAALVPKYLAAIPADPFSPTGDCLKLTTFKGIRILYSVGEDQIDNGGALSDRGLQWWTPDMLFLLDVPLGP